LVSVVVVIFSLVRAGFEAEVEAEARLGGVRGVR